MKIHYAGEINWRGGRVLPGWAACCSGDRAVTIRERGQNTRNAAAVTCKVCLKMIEKQQQFYADGDARDRLVHAVLGCDDECGAAPSSLSSLQHLQDDHDGPTVDDARRAIKYRSGTLAERLATLGLKMRHKPRWEFDVEITRLDNWTCELPNTTKEDP